MLIKSSKKILEYSFFDFTKFKARQSHSHERTTRKRLETLEAVGPRREAERPVLKSEGFAVCRQEWRGSRIRSS